MSDNFIIYYIKSVNTIICKNKNKKINLKSILKNNKQNNLYRNKHTINIYDGCAGVDVKEFNFISHSLRREDVNFSFGDPTSNIAPSSLYSILVRI